MAKPGFHYILFHLFYAQLRNSLQKRRLPFISIYSMWLKAFIHPISQPAPITHILLNIVAAPIPIYTIPAYTDIPCTQTQNTYNNTNIQRRRKALNILMVPNLNSVVQAMCIFIVYSVYGKNMKAARFYCRYIGIGLVGNVWGATLSTLALVIAEDGCLGG